MLQEDHRTTFVPFFATYSVMVVQLLKCFRVECWLTCHLSVTNLQTIRLDRSSRFRSNNSTIVTRRIAMRQGHWPWTWSTHGKLVIAMYKLWIKNILNKITNHTKHNWHRLNIPFQQGAIGSYFSSVHGKTGSEARQKIEDARAKHPWGPR